MDQENNRDRHYNAVLRDLKYKNNFDGIYYIIKRTFILSIA